MKKIEELKEFLLERKYFIVLGGMIVLLLIIGICLIIMNAKTDQEIVLEANVLEKQEEVEVEAEDIECSAKVDIKGEIKAPGLYELKCEDRVLDVINLAGGLTTKADTSVLNLGKKVTDEMVIVVLSKEQVTNYESEVKKVEEKIENCNQGIKNDACIKEENIYISENKIETNTNTSNNDETIGDTPVNSLVSINNATIDELMTLSGIGKSKAESIISYRETNGGFKSVEELKNVKGIGDKIFEKIKTNITL